MFKRAVLVQIAETVALELNPAGADAVMFSFLLLVTYQRFYMSTF